MTSEDFIFWLKGFVAGSHNFNLTPSGWEEVKKKLDEVVHTSEYIINVPKVKEITPHPFKDPYNPFPTEYPSPYGPPYKVTCTI